MERGGSIATQPVRARRPTAGLPSSPGVRLVMVMAALVWTQLPLGDGARAAGGHMVEICCGWGSSIADGNLNFSLKGSDPVSLDVMRAAVREWDTALAQLRLTEVDPGAEDVSLTFLDAAGRTEGEAITSFSRRGMIRRVDITIRGGRAPMNSGGLEQITKHEFGHALGLGHANFTGDLMSAAVSPNPAPLPVCDVAGVLQANRWKLVEELAKPSRPALRNIECSAA